MLYIILTFVEEYFSVAIIYNYFQYIYIYMYTNSTNNTTKEEPSSPGSLPVFFYSYLFSNNLCEHKTAILLKFTDIQLILSIILGIFLSKFHFSIHCTIKLQHNIEIPLFLIPLDIKKIMDGSVLNGKNYNI